MHPIERLRHVARATETDLPELVQEAALALIGFADDPVALVTACRSLVDRHPAAGSLWWLASRVLTATDAASEAWQAAEEVELDDTADSVYRAVPEGAQVLVVGWTAAIAGALGRRGDCRLLVVGPRSAFGRSFGTLLRTGVELEEVPEAGLGAAAAACELVVVEAQAMGADGLVAPSGSHAALAVAAAAGHETWAVAPCGRVLPDGLWQVVAGRVGEVAEPWLEPDELVPLSLLTGVVRAGGLVVPAAAAAQADCGFAPELVRRLEAPGTHR